MQVQVQVQVQVHLGGQGVQVPSLPQGLEVETGGEVEEGRVEGEPGGGRGAGGGVEGGRGGGHQAPQHCGAVAPGQPLHLLGSEEGAPSTEHLKAPQAQHLGTWCSAGSCSTAGLLKHHQLPKYHKVWYHMVGMEKLWYGKVCNGIVLTCMV